MTTVEVKSIITVKLGAHEFDLTRTEAQTLFNALKKELEPNPYQSILNQNNILFRNGLGPMIGQGTPTFVPFQTPFDGRTVTC